MPETTTAPKCRACIEQGIPGECTDPAHQVAPEIGDLPPPPPKWSDPGYLARAAEQHRATADPRQLRPDLRWHCIRRLDAGPPQGRRHGHARDHREVAQAVTTSGTETNGETA